ncbi:MAG: CHASE3 domain-containing protein, partial [Povalibacter sp.]
MHSVSRDSNEIVPKRSSVSKSAANPVLWMTGGAVLVLALGALWVLVSVTSQVTAVRRSHAMVQYTRELLEGVQTVMSSLQDAETGERGYVITGREEFLEPYNRARETLDTDLRSIDALISDRQAQETLDQLTNLAQQHVSFLENVIELRRAGDIDGARVLIRQQTGKELMDRVRVLVQQLKARQQQLLAERLGAFEKASVRSEQMVQWALGSTIVLVLLGGAFLGRDVYRRLAAEQSAAAAATLLRSTLDSISQGVVVFDSQRRVIAWNRRYLELRGIEPDVMRVGLPAEDMFKVASPFTLTVAGEQHDSISVAKTFGDMSQPFDGEASTPTGEMLEICGRPVTTGNYIVTVTDVTALKKSEAAYRDQATRLSAIL